MDGAHWLAAALKSAGTSHVFFVDAILRRTLIALEGLGVARVLAHSEKAAAYMADGYARISGRPGVCLAQSVGAANARAPSGRGAHGRDGRPRLLRLGWPFSRGAVSRARPEADRSPAGAAADRPDDADLVADRRAPPLPR